MRPSLKSAGDDEASDFLPLPTATAITRQMGEDRSMIMRQTMAVALACQLCCLPVLAAAGQACPPGLVQLNLNGLEIDLDEPSGAIVRLFHPDVGTMLKAGPGGGGLLDVAYPIEAFIPMRLASRFSKARVVREAGGVTIQYEPLGPSRTHCVLPEGKVLARVTVRAAEDGRSVVLKCSIDNQSSGSIPQILFPDLHGLRLIGSANRTTLQACFSSKFRSRKVQKLSRPKNACQGTSWRTSLPAFSAYPGGWTSENLDQMLVSAS